MAVSWAVTPEKIDAAVARIVEVAQPSRVIVFGSAASGALSTHSDLDVLVVLPDGSDTSRRESVRIRQALGGILMPIDVLVVTEGRLKELANRTDLVYREALRTGILIYDGRVHDGGA